MIIIYDEKTANFYLEDEGEKGMINIDQILESGYAVVRLPLPGHRCSDEVRTLIVASNLAETDDGLGGCWSWDPVPADWVHLDEVDCWSGRTRMTGSFWIVQELLTPFEISNWY